MLVIFMGFTFALTFIMARIHGDFASISKTAIALFRAMLGDFDFDAFQYQTDEGTEINEWLILFGYFAMCLYLVISSIVLLNLLIAMMAKTFGMKVLLYFHAKFICKCNT